MERIKSTMLTEGERAISTPFMVPLKEDNFRYLLHLKIRLTCQIDPSPRSGEIVRCVTRYISRGRSCIDVLPFASKHTLKSKEHDEKSARNITLNRDQI
jgi:hypothetical protein